MSMSLRFLVRALHVCAVCWFLATATLDSVRLRLAAPGDAPFWWCIRDVCVHIHRDDPFYIQMCVVPIAPRSPSVSRPAP